MSAPFLRGEGVTLHALDSPIALPARLAAPELSAGVDRAFALSVRVASGEVVGSLGLEGIDWVERRARLTARGEPPVVAIRLVVGYAFGELNLDFVEALAPDAEWARVLADAGFLEGPGSLWTAERPRF